MKRLVYSDVRAETTHTIRTHEIPVQYLIAKTREKTYNHTKVLRYLYSLPLSLSFVLGLRVYVPRLSSLLPLLSPCVPVSLWSFFERAESEKLYQ
jgi:Ni,Fe-hydrogenase III component G